MAYFKTKLQIIVHDLLKMVRYQINVFRESFHSSKLLLLKGSENKCIFIWRINYFGDFIQKCRYEQKWKFNNSLTNKYNPEVRAWFSWNVPDIFPDWFSWNVSDNFSCLSRESMESLPLPFPSHFLWGPVFCQTPE